MRDKPWAVALVALLNCAAAAAAQPAAVVPPVEIKDPPGGQLILNDSSLWAVFYAWKTPVVRKVEGGPLQDGPNSSSYGPIFAAQSPLPPTGWFQPDFDDSTWGRTRIRHHGRVDYGFWDTSPALSVLCLRGKFKVDDPAAVRGLKLAMTFRGGVVVYLNGKEMARAFLPKDKVIDADTLADDYPPETFIRPDKQCISIFSIHDEGRVIRSDSEALAKRIRELRDVELKPADLRKGTNVLALELHRAPYFGNGLEKENGNHVSAWGTCGLVRLAACAEGGVEPNISRPKGVQVWPASVTRRSSPLDYADPLDKPAPLRIAACRNGRFTGKVMIASDTPLAGVKAAVSDLKSRDGKAAIPATQVDVFYVVRDDAMLLGRRAEGGLGFWDTLSRTPPAQIDVWKTKGAGTRTLSTIG